jgi:DNA-binding NarL/FixJ family response regulator
MVDDHPLLREGLASVIHNHSELRLVAEAENGVQAIDAFRKFLPDITLMDLQMPDMDGEEASRRILAEFPEAKIVVLTTYKGDAQVVRAMKAGAYAYLPKNTARACLLQTIRDVHRGHRVLHTEVASSIAQYITEDALSNREIDVLQRVALGHSNKTIAGDLGIGEETVKSHIRSVFTKLQARDRTHAAMIAVRRGIIRFPEAD